MRPVIRVLPSVFLLFFAPLVAGAWPISVSDLTPFANTGAVNGGGIAARDGYIYVEEYGSSGMNSRVIRISPDGSVNMNWLTGVVSGFKPYITPTGQLWLTGDDFKYTLPQRQIARIDAFDPLTGASLGPVFVDGSDYCWTTTAAMLPDGSAVFGTSNYPVDIKGIRKVSSPNQANMISPGYGNNTHLAVAQDGRLLLGSGYILGFIDGSGVFQKTFQTTYVSDDRLQIVSVVPLPDGAVLLATQLKVMRLAPDLSTARDLLTTGVSSFASLTLDAVRNTIVARLQNGNVYVIPVPDGAVEARALSWGRLKTLYR